MFTLKDMGLKEKKGGVDFEPVPQGRYDAYVHAVISLGLQPQQPDFKTGKPNDPDTMLRVLFEIPSVVRTDGQTSLVKLDMRQSANEKSYYYALYKALYGVDTNLEKVVSTPVNDLLGKVLSLNVTVWSNPKTNRSGNNIKKDGLIELDARLKEAVSPITRETFVFNPYKPDLTIFKDKLSYYTQKNIMESLDSGQYPEELINAWGEIQKTNTKGGSVDDAATYNTEAIE